jgi:hypothetical protein
MTRQELTEALLQFDAVMDARGCVVVDKLTVLGAYATLLLGSYPPELADRWIEQLVREVRLLAPEAGGAVTGPSAVTFAAGTDAVIDVAIAEGAGDGNIP